MLDFESTYYKEGYKLIVGIDEAGRGPLCGPVVAACCILPKNYKNEHINDSKKLSEKNREIAYSEIIENAMAFGIGIIDAETIDKYNIYEATKMAMLRAISNMKHDFDLCITDAMPLIIENKRVIPIIKGDAKAECIAAASIIAKVTRDHIMYDYDLKYPEYGFKNNKGYGTKKHMEALERFGPIPHFHRYSFAPVFNSKNEQLKIF